MGRITGDEFPQLPRRTPIAWFAVVALTLALVGLCGPEMGIADERVRPPDTQEGEAVPGATSDPGHLADSTVSAERLIANGTCPCGCGNPLPGSGQPSACFGCSVGKTEVTFIRESLAAGQPLAEVLLALRELVLVEVFADYTDPALPAVWQRARRAADELGSHRVVLRAPGLDEPARAALVVVECARGSGAFSLVQQALIEHGGPWGEATVVKLAFDVLHSATSGSSGSGGDGWTLESLRYCVETSDLSLQVERDRRHAGERAMESFPAVSVNRERVPDTLESLRRAIRAALQEGSI